MRRIGLASMVLVMLSGCGAAPKAETAADKPGVTVVLPLDIEAGVAPADAIKDMRTIAAVVKKQPGLIDESLVSSQTGVGPRYLHVMRWSSLEDFEKMSGSPDFQAVLDANLKRIRVESAAVYKPVP